MTLLAATGLGKLTFAENQLAKSNFVHLHNHSDYSLKDATARPHDVAKRLHDIDQKSYALTDHGMMTGIAVFDKEFKKAGLKLIAGLEAYVALLGADDRSARDTAHITLLAMDMEGYHNLCKIHTLSWQDAYYYNPRTDFDLLDKYSAGIIALSGCLGGVLLKPFNAGDTGRALSNLKTLKQIYGNRFYIELQDHHIEEDEASIEWLLAQAKKNKLPIVATNDAHYVNKGDWKAHDMVIACGMGQRVGDPARQIAYRPEEFYLKDYAEMAQRFDPAELAMSQKIADLCEPLKLESESFHIPMVDKKGMPALRVIALLGIEDRFGKTIEKLPNKYLERFNYELKAIDKGGFTQYLLLMHDMYVFMNEKGIPYGPGRGSAAASLVCYALGITGVDPLAYDLLFERFINPARISAPDIDCDISAERRGEVVEYLKSRWGADRVSQIVTFGTMGARSAIRDMARTLIGTKESLALADKLAKLIPKNGSLTTDREDRDYINEALASVKELKAIYDTNKDAKRIIDAAIEVEGIIKNASVHAAGIVIADRPIVEYAPLLTTSPKVKDDPRPLSVAFAMNELEHLGLIKFDLLGLAAPDIIKHTVEGIIKDKLVKKDFHIDDIPLDDAKTFSLLGLGLTAGVFQFECVAGDTILNGDPRKTIADCYLDPPKRMTSVDLGEGKRRVNNVLKIIQSGEKQLYRLNTEHNYTLRATRDHKILTERGWLTLGDIQINDLIVVNRKDASRIGSCKDCAVQIKSRAERCYSCSNVIRDSGATMSKNRDHNEWMKSLARGKDHPWWGGHPRTVNLEFDDLDHPVSSKWEADFARYLIATRKPYLYEPKTFTFSDGSGYTPDFYIPDDDVWIEIKGKSGLCGRSKTKVERFRKEFSDETIVVITAHQIAEFELDNPKLAKWNCPTLPNGFEFERVTSIVKDQVEMTYDVAMESPLNNYIANGIVVHNSGGMAGWLRKLKPDHINDLIAMVALYRPGPMAFIEKYVDRKHGEAKVEYPDKRLKPALEQTYGIAVYQEQLMQIGVIIAGWSLSRADQLRKVIGKKIIDKIEQEGIDFANDAAKNGYKKEWAKKLFDEFIAPAGKYSFNKGHATVYGLLAYQTAYLKANFSLHYFAALLANVAASTKADKTEKTAAYIADARTMGIAILPPDIHESGLNFTPVFSKQAIRFGLLAIKNVGAKAIDIMVKERDKHGPYTSLFDFVDRTSNRLITSRTIESLVFAGALDSLPGDRFEKAASVEAACTRVKMHNEDRKRIVAGGKAVNRKKTIPRDELLEPDETISATNLLSKERELIGTYLSGHPFNDVADEAHKASSVSLQELRDLGSDVSATICGIVSNVNKITTKKKQIMYTITIEDDKVSQEVIIFPQAAKHYGDMEAWLDKPIVIFGRLEGDDDDDNANPKLILDKMHALESAPIRRKSLRTNEDRDTRILPSGTNAVNRYHLTPSNYKKMIAAACAPCVFVFESGEELICG
jgi:DNA polymerase III alpha subunit